MEGKAATNGRQRADALFIVHLHRLLDPDSGRTAARLTDRAAMDYCQPIATARSAANPALEPTTLDGASCYHHLRDDIADRTEEDCDCGAADPVTLATYRFLTRL